MKRIRPALIALLLATPPAMAAAQEVIDLDNLPNHANQPVPPYITRDNTRLGNDITDLGATLGRVLFYDRKLSTNDTISCSSCHEQSRAFGDNATASPGVNGLTGRHSMRLVNLRFGMERRVFWDERAADAEEQATQPIRDHAEMGFSGQNGGPDFDDLITKMEGIPYYPFLFERVFGDSAITEQRMQLAIAQFVRSIQSFDSRYDTGRAQVGNDGAPFPNFSTQENQGKQLFLDPPQFNPQGMRVGGGAGCAGCHRPPEFDIDPLSLSNGVVGSLSGAIDATNRRSPSLRNVTGVGGTSNGPFMHDGSFTSLESVVQHYNSPPAIIGTAEVRPNIDPRLLPGGNIQRLQLTNQQMDNIVAFLATLSGNDVYTDARWSDPFDANGELRIRQLVLDVQGWVVH